MNYSKYNDRKSYDILGDRQYFFSNGKIFIGKNFYSLGGMFAHDNAFLFCAIRVSKGGFNFWIGKLHKAESILFRCTKIRKSKSA